MERTHASNVSVTIAQAVRGAPPLARLLSTLAESRARLEVIRPLLPVALRTTISAGPLDAGGWRLFVTHNAAAAKLRQLQPALLQALGAAQLPVTRIQIRVQQPTAHRVPR